METRSRFAGFVGLAALIALAIGLTLVLKYLSTDSETATTYPISNFTPTTSQVEIDRSYPEPVVKITDTSAPVNLHPYPVPNATPEVFYNVPPPCQADAELIARSTQTSLPSSQNYVFSKPREITNTSSIIDVIQWLPDSRRLLLLGGNEKGQFVETFDIISEETYLYAQNLENPGLILWVPEEQAVAYVDRKTRSGITQSAIMLSTSVSETKVLLEDFSFVGNGRPALNVKLPDTLAQKLNPVYSFNPELWKYDKFHNEETEVWRRIEHKATISTNGARIAFYYSPWLLIVNTKTGQPCEIDLSPYSIRAIQAEWSKDGRYLAMLTTSDYPGRIMPFGHVAIFDLLTGKLVHIDKIRYTTKIDWLPYSHELLIFGLNDLALHDDHLYLINPEGMQLYPVLSDYKFWGSIDRGPDHILSPDGNLLAIRCQDGNLCIISVTSNP